MIYSAKISLLIEQICQKCNIKYISKNPDKITVCSDAAKLGEIILEIETLIDKLHIILDRHKIENEIKSKIEEDLFSLHSIDHDLIKLAKKLIQEEKKND